MNTSAPITRVRDPAQPPVPSVADPRVQAGLLAAYRLIWDTVDRKLWTHVPGELLLVLSALAKAVEDWFTGHDSPSAARRRRARGALLFVLEALYTQDSRFQYLTDVIGCQDHEYLADALRRVWRWVLSTDRETAEALLAERVQAGRRARRMQGRDADSGTNEAAGPAGSPADRLRELPAGVLRGCRVLDLPTD